MSAPDHQLILYNSSEHKQYHTKQAIPTIDGFILHHINSFIRLTLFIFDSDCQN